MPVMGQKKIMNTWNKIILQLMSSTVTLIENKMKPYKVKDLLAPINYFTMSSRIIMYTLWAKGWTILVHIHKKPARALSKPLPTIRQKNVVPVHSTVYATNQKVIESSASITTWINIYNKPKKTWKLKRHSTQKKAMLQYRAAMG